MGIRVKYGGEAGMQWEGKGSKRSSVGFDWEGREGVKKEKEEDWNEKGKEEDWNEKGRVEGRDYSIIIIVIIRKGREGLSKGREL